MKHFTRSSFIFAVCALATFALTTPPATAAERGTTEEAVMLVDKAVSALQSDKPSALEQISDPAGPFVDRDLYVIVFNEQGVIQAHGANKRMVGKNLSKVKDPDGVMFVQEFFKSSAKAPEGGWVNFKFTHPQTKKIENKVMWVRDLDGWLVMAGAYPDK